MLRVRNQAKLVVHSRHPISICLSKEQLFSTADPEQENNQETSDKPQVPQADPPVIGLHNRSLE
jgi:hypothetical protein